MPKIELKTDRKRGVNPEILTPKQRLFVEAYLSQGSMNAAKAAREAGYANDAVAGHKLLKNTNVKAVIEKRYSMMIWDYQAERERVLRELTSIAFMNPQNFLNPNGSVKSLQELPQEVARTISSLKISYHEEEDEVDGTYINVKNIDIKFWDKMGALEMLMKHLGLYEPEKHQHDVSVSVKWDEMVVPHANAGVLENDPIEERITQVIENTNEEEKPSVRVLKTLREKRKKKIND